MSGHCYIHNTGWIFGATCPKCLERKMMKARFMIENPDEIECTMKLTMSVKEWCELRDQLSRSHPSWELSAAINDLLSQARKVYYAEE